MHLLLVPQAMMPFSEEELEYIAALNPAADCELLRRELPALRPECGRTLQVATALLQAAAAAGLRYRLIDGMPWLRLRREGRVVPVSLQPAVSGQAYLLPAVLLGSSHNCTEAGLPESESLLPRDTAWRRSGR